MNEISTQIVIKAPKNIDNIIIYIVNENIV